MRVRAVMVLATCMVATIAISLGAASYKFTSTWKAPGTAPFNFAGRKVAALVITTDESLRVSAEEALAREITTRGPQGVAAYKLIPREELTDKDKARGWFERSGVEGVVAMRIVGVEKEKVYNAAIWSSSYYGNFWDYYGYGWTSVYPIGKGRDEMTLAVETLLYNVADARLLWASVSETTDPKGVGPYMKGLVSAVVKELQKEGLVPKASK